jgi:hypothetical protein
MLELTTSCYIIPLRIDPTTVTFHQNHHVVWQTKITNFWRNGNDTKQAYKYIINIQCYIFVILTWQVNDLDKLITQDIQTTHIQLNGDKITNRATQVNIIILFDKVFVFICYDLWLYSFTCRFVSQKGQ